MATLDRREAIPVWCRIRIPHTYKPSPVLSTLASRYSLDINITTACLGAKGIQDGWFDLVLSGQSYQVFGGLRYLKHLQVEITQLGPKTFLTGLSSASSHLPLPHLPTALNDEMLVLAPAERGPTVQTCEVEVTIPPELRYQPVLFSLVHSHRLAVAIVGALLEPNHPEPGRFELVLSGPQRSIDSGLASLREQALIT